MYRKAGEHIDPASPHHAGGSVICSPRVTAPPSINDSRCLQGGGGSVGQGRDPGEQKPLTAHGSEPPKPRLTKGGRAGTAVPDLACRGCAEMTHPATCSSTLPTSNK